MKKLLLSLLFIVSVLVITCKKDDNDNPNNNYPTPTSDINVRIVGTVVDENGNTISGATLRVGNTMKSSDNNGFFVFENVKVPSKRYFVSASKEGFFESGYGGTPTNVGVHYVRIQLIQLGTSNLINGTTGGTVTSPDGAKVIFPANAFETSSGVPITGAVSVYIKHLSPADANFAAQIPGGDLAYSNSTAELSPLISFGMMGVTLLDQSGIKLRLAAGVSAEIRFPIASSQQGAAPASIPLLSFDAVKGVWKQEGTATKNSNEYVGTVSHFSWWNCDVITSAPVPTIIGKVVDCNGVPLPGIVVSVNSQYSVITNSLGIYTNWVPPSIPISLQVVSGMNNGLVLSSAITTITTGPGTNVVPDLVVPCPTRFAGSVVDCDGNPTQFYTWASWNNGSTIATFSTAGNFNMIVPPNQTLTLHLSNGQFTKDTLLTAGNTGATVNLGAITLCNNSGNTQGCTGGPSIVYDIEGNVYHVVQIGNQCWMKDNLKTGRYRNGDTIEYMPRTPIVPDSVWQSTTTGAYTTIDNAVYGKLYNWYAVADPRGLCPTGWHVADSSEMVELSLFLGGDAVAGGALKQAGTQQAGTGLWMSPNSGGTNVSGFTALPGGFRAGGTGGNGSRAFIWTSTEGNAVSGWLRVIADNNTIFSPQGASKYHGSSVRCIHD